MKDVHGKIWQMINTPHVDVVCESIANGKGTIAISIFSRQGKTIFNEKRNVKVKKCSCTIEFRLPEPLVEPARVEVILKINRKKITQEKVINIHRISGKVTNFKGNPMQAYVWAIPEREVQNVSKKGFDGAVVQADKQGRYELWLPEETIKGIFIDDESYHKTTYECWVWNVNLKRNIKINPRIDKVELYNLNVWQAYLGENVFHIHFIPCSISTYPKESLKLTKNDIRVYVNGKAQRIRSFTEHHPWKMGIGPSYLLDVEATDFDNQNSIIQVMVETKSKTGEKAIKEKGEAYYIGFYR